MKTTPTIYIADDDELDITLLKDSLTGRNPAASFMTFHNGLVLLFYLKTNSDVLPDLIVLDINMPVKNGFLTLHELKQNALLKSIPVIMMSSSVRQEDELRCLQMGGVALFQKPGSMLEYNSLAEKILLLV